MQPLAGITVVNMEQAASRQLADLGARVIKLERQREDRPCPRQHHGGWSLRASPC